MEQKINSRKTDEGYFVEVLNDGKVVWTDTFDTEKELNWFIKCCDDGRKIGCFPTSQEEGRKQLENGESWVDIFYRNPFGFRIASISNFDVAHISNQHGFQVFIVDKNHDADSRIVPTIDEAFQLIKAVENGEI